MSLKSDALLRDAAYINGQWCQADNKGTFEVKNPADGTVIGRVPDMKSEETKRAIAAAARAFQSWRKASVKERVAVLKKIYDLMMVHKDALAALITLEMGKPIVQARAEVDYAASYFEWFAEEARRGYGETIPSPFPDGRVVTVQEPVGVCAFVTPWNFPLAMVARKVAPAIAAGCTCVLKPAEATPLSALAIAMIAEHAGLPQGVLNVVTGNEPIPITRFMCELPEVRKLSFTGSTEVGRIMMRQCSKTLKKLTLELGGNAPFIVFDDADIDAAVEGAMAAKFRNGGQSCIAANRFYVHAGAHDKFVSLIEKRVRALNVGAGFDEKNDVGPVMNAAAMEKINAHIEDAKKAGAKVLIGGQKHEAGDLFFQPTILTNMQRQMKISCEETFGPVLAIYKFKSEDDVIAMANDIEHGLASYFYTKDMARVWRVAEALEFGMVGINTGSISAAEVPFGGVKHSGLGREGGREGLREYQETKYMLMSGIMSQ